MTIFAVLLPVENAALAERINSEFPHDHYRLSGTQWIISSNLTTVDLSAKLGVFDPGKPDAAPIGNAVIFSTSSYYGRAPQTLWEWMKNKLERPAGV